MKKKTHGAAANSSAYSNAVKAATAGNIVVTDLYFRWCDKCRKYERSFMRAAENLASKGTAAFFGINVLEKGHYRS